MNTPQAIDILAVPFLGVGGGAASARVRGRGESTSCQNTPAKRAERRLVVTREATSEQRDEQMA